VSKHNRDQYVAVFQWAHTLKDAPGTVRVLLGRLPTTPTAS
jgi:hypothetical protein